MDVSQYLRPQIQQNHSASRTLMPHRSIQSGQITGFILHTSDTEIQSSYLSGNSSQSMDVSIYLSRQPFHFCTDRPQNMCCILRTWYCEVAITYVSSGEYQQNCGDSWGSTPFSPASQWRCSRLGSKVV